MLRTPDICHKYKSIFLPLHLQNISALSTERKFRLRSHTRVGMLRPWSEDGRRREHTGLIGEPNRYNRK